MEEFIQHITDNQQIRIFIDILIAGCLAMMVGIERENAKKAAGIRTNMIVSSFTCLIFSLTKPLIHYINMNEVNIDTDPVRVIQSVVIGISFIGAGTIIKTRDRERVTGLTTAATLLYSVGIGICVAIHNYLLALLLMLFILVINYVVNFVTKKYTSIKDR